MSLPNTQYLLNTPTGVKENSVCHLCPDSFIGALNTLNIYPMTRKRASSFKRDKHLDFFQDEGMRPRTSSAPTKNTLRKPKLHRTNLGLNIQPDDDQYTVRSFKMNSKGVIVVGDSMRSRSANSLNLLTGEMCQFCPLSRTSSTISPDSVATSPGSVTNNTGFPSRVLVFGSSSVGKTALTQQFMTSEYLGGFDTSVDGEAERSVNVLLDGEETSVSFTEQSDEQFNYNDFSAFLLVYASDDRLSFDRAVDTLYNIRSKQHRNDIIIVVGNKSDLVRSRCVTTEEAKAVAVTYDCKFVETSVVLNLNVDELLVGIVKQLRLKFGDNDGERRCASTGKLLLNKLFKKDSISKSCENLFR